MFASFVALVAAGGLGAPVGFSPPRPTDAVPASSIEGDPGLTRSRSRLMSRLLHATETSQAQTLAAAEPVVEAPPAPAEVAPVDRPLIAPPRFSRPPRPPRPPKPIDPSPGPREGGVWALVVGIDDYPGADADLRAGAADARDVDAALAAYGVPPQRRIVLLDHQATADNIRAGLGWLANRAAPEATVVFFYSGHVRQVTGDADRDGEDVDEAIVAADGDPVYDGEVAAIFRNLAARSVWLGIAGCYGSGFDDALATGRLLTAAAAEADLAYENSALGHSYLVEYMVRRAMLQGRASGSVQEAFRWAQGQIARDYPNRQPVMIDRAQGPLVLGARSAPQSGPPAQSASEQPAPPAAAEPQPSPEKEPETPAPAESEEGGDGDACAEVLGVSVCSSSNSSLRVIAGAGWRRAIW